MEPRSAEGKRDLLLIAVSDPPRPWVGCADPPLTAQRLRGIVAAQPGACLALVQVLRVGPDPPPPDRLVVEPFAYSTLQVADPTVTRSTCTAAPRPSVAAATSRTSAPRPTRRGPTTCAAKVIAHLRGVCVGAGIEPTALAGRVAATPDMGVRLPEINTWLFPGAGGTASMPARISRERTASLALTGAALSSTETLRWGWPTSSPPGDAGSRTY
ncbi:enoyl-CoA hydratase-related protein [Streptomyces sp. NPDC050698]